MVAADRRRNLLLSFGVLLLLAVSMALIIVSTQRARRLARLQMEFVAGVSHELRTPVAVICSAADNLAEGFVGAKDQVKEYGALIRNEGRRLAGMIEQILRFAGGPIAAAPPTNWGRWRWRKRSPGCWRTSRRCPKRKASRWSARSTRICLPCRRTPRL